MPVRAKVLFAALPGVLAPHSIQCNAGKPCAHSSQGARRIFPGPSLCREGRGRLRDLPRLEERGWGTAGCNPPCLEVLLLEGPGQAGAENQASC